MRRPALVGFAGVAGVSALIFVVLATPGCQAGGPEGASVTEAVDAAGVAVDAPVQWIPNVFLARPDDQDWVERIPIDSVGEAFVVYVEPQVRTPAEGPWRLTLTRDGDPSVLRLPGLTVDRSTGRLTFLMQSSLMPRGSYRMLLELEAGGVAIGPHAQGFRFRIE